MKNLLNLLVTSCVLLLLTHSGKVLGADGKGSGTPEWKVGVATVDITPDRPIRMRGYGGFSKMLSQGVAEKLYSKAITIEDEQGTRTVIVAMDLIGVLASFREQVAEQVEAKYKIPQHALLLNASHTHGGPAYGRDDAKDYFDVIVKKIVSLVGESIDRLEPANLTYSHARAGFAMNRRLLTPDKGYKIRPNPDGPVDHDVPVLRVAGADGELRAVMFGYACHNTTVGVCFQINGDYAGYAQKFFEKDNPGVTALFLTGCGGDQNPAPRGKDMLDVAENHGRALATAVEGALSTHQKPLHGPLRSTLKTFDLEFTTKDRPPFPYPIQILQFGNDLALIALGTEVVVDYSLRLKRELGDRGPAIWVAAYSNVYDGYIPSKRVLLEGGYEAKSRPWKPVLEERIINGTHELFDSFNSK